MLTADAEECPLLNKCNAVIEYDLVFEKSIVDARGVTVKHLSRATTQNGNARIE